jgi:hypothetical protein
MARLRIDGKMNKEAMRCFKRHLSGVVFRQLLADLKAVDVATRMVPARSLRQVARRSSARALSPEETALITSTAERYGQIHLDGAAS